MAERLAYLEAVVGADITQFRKGMRDVRSEVGLLDETMTGMAAVGRSMTFAITVPLLALGTGAVQAASEFDSAMRNVNSILQLTEDKFQALSQVALDFGSTIRGGPMAAAQALYIVASAGITDVAAATSFMEIASRTAEAGLADLETTTTALVAAYLSYGGGAMDAAAATALLERQSDILTQTVQLGVGNMNVFATSLGKVVPTVVALGGSFEDTGAALAFLTQRGLNAATAGVSLGSALTALIKPSDAMKAAFQQLGVASGDELVTKFGGLEEALIAVIQTAEGSTAKLGELFQNRQAQRAIFLMRDDIDGLNQTVLEFQAGIEGATDRAHEQQMMSFAAHWDLMTSAISGAAIAIGDQMLPVLMPVVDGIANLALQLGQTNPEVLALGVGFAAAAAAAGPILWILSSLVNPLAAIIVGVGALATAFAADFGGIREIVATAVGDILGDLTPLQSLIDEVTAVIFPPDAEATMQSAIPHIEVEATDFVTVKAGDSLWSIWFEGYQDQFTWEQFKEQVGWEQHTLQPGDVIVIDGTFREGLLGAFDRVKVSMAEIMNRVIDRTNAQMTGDNSWMVDGLPDPNMAPFEEDLFLRIQGAVAGVADRLGPVFETLVESARAWFDEKAGEGIQWIASLFEFSEAGGSTPIYDAVNKLLDLDITGAINAVFPTLGTKIENAVGGWGESIKAAFPNISTALGVLFDKVGTWVLQVGIPTFARIAGNVGGHLAASLYDAISGAIRFLSSGGVANGAEAVGTYLGETVAPELVAGFNEGIAGSALESEGIPGLEAIFASISEALDLLNVDALVTGFGDLGSGISNFASDLAGADWTGVQWIIDHALLLAGALTALFNSTVGAAISNFGDWLGVAGDSIANLANTISAIVNLDAEGVLAGIGRGLTQMAAGFLMIPAGIVDTVKTLIETITDTEIDLPDLTTAIETWASDAEAQLAAREIRVDTIRAVPGGYIIDVSNPENVEIALESLGELYAPLAEAIRLYMAENPPTAEVTSLQVAIDPNSTTTLTTGLDQLTDGLRFQVPTATAEVQTLGYLIGPNTTGVIEAGSITPTLVVPNATGEVLDFTLDATDTTITNTPNIPEAVLPTDTLNTHMNAEGVKAVTSFGGVLLDAVAAGGAIDPAIITDNFLIPLSNNIVTYLGEDSLAVAAFTGFADTSSSRLDGVGEKVMDLLTIIGIDFPAITTVIGTQTPVITGFLDGVRGAVDSLKDAFSAMAAAARDALSVAGTVPGGPILAGARANGGNTQAGDAYLVGEEGPELWTSKRSGRIISNDALRSGLGSGGGRGGDIYYQTVNITEAANLDAILREAKRRNIKFT